MPTRKMRTFVGDFETTVYDEQETTEVWASALVEIGTEEVQIFHSITETWEYLVSLKENVCVYYHNLKFDGTFWIYYFLKELKLKQAVKKSEDSDVKFLREKDMPNKSFKYSISNMGQWYIITVKINNKIIEIRDSLKLLPFSVKRIGDSFGTKHKKLDMEYTGYRYAGCEITDEEKKYIANDVLVIKEALEIMKEQGHEQLTIGSCCLHEFKETYHHSIYDEYFPNLYDIELAEEYGAKSVGEYIRNSYHGGWCYVAKGKERKEYHNGITADVNSLYPSMMSSESGNRFPIGTPIFWKGNFIPQQAEDEMSYYFVRIKTRFYIKKNRLPCIQIKGDLRYNSIEWLESSDLYSEKYKKYFKVHRTIDGKIEPAYVILTLTQTDFALIKDQYNLVDFEILDGCYFYSEVGIFDKYIEKYKKIKMESKGALRELAKLFLNNLYGKLAASVDSSFKIAYEKEDGTVGYRTVIEFDKKPGYIPCGSAITSYARNFTIRAAQANYYGVDEPGFIYADTDSIHCNLPADRIKGIKVDAKKFCCWKLESMWDRGYFVRQKTYFENVIAEDIEPGKEIEYLKEPQLNIRCAGMPQRCKDLFVDSMKGMTEKEWIESTEERKEKKKRTWDDFSDEEKEFVLTKHTLEDFDIGLEVPGKLMPKQVPGGTLLVESTYKMKGI